MLFLSWVIKFETSQFVREKGNGSTRNFKTRLDLCVTRKKSDKMDPVPQTLNARAVVKTALAVYLVELDH